MIKVAVVRGKYLNNFEMQNYRIEDKELSITGISSQKSIHTHFPFPIIRLPSLADLQDIAFLDRPIKVVANRILGDSQILFGLEKYADEFDIFHTADPHYYYSYQLARLRAENKIKKLVVTSWETIPFNNESILKKKYIKYFVLEHADKFICYTEKARHTLIKEGVNPSKINLIRLGVDLDRFKNQKPKIKDQKYNLKSKKIHLLFVGRLVEEKGIIDLLEAIRELSISNYELRIVGDGPLKEQVKSWIKKNNLQNNIYIEQKSYDEMPEVYNKADIFVLLSKRSKTWEEQYGMVLVEALASGLPIIAYDSGATSEVVGHAGLLVEERNVKQLSALLHDLVLNPQKCQLLSHASRIRAEKEFDKNQTASKLAKMYKRLYDSI